MLPVIEGVVKKYGRGLGQKKGLVYRTDVDKLNDKALMALEEDIDDKVEKKFNS